MKQDSPIASRSRQRALLRPAAVIALVAGVVAAGWQLSAPRTVTVMPVMRGPAIQAVYAT